MREGAFVSLLAIALFSHAPVEARYKFDQADVPADFSCDSDQSVDECERAKDFEAWNNRYGDKWDKWFFALAHNPNLYFFDFGYGDDPDDGDYSSNVEPASWIDISHSIALRRYSGWTAAVNGLCDDGTAHLTSDKCRPVVRMVRPIRFDPNDLEAQRRRVTLEAQSKARGRPTSQTELAEDFKSEMQWLEADVRNCSGLSRHLRILPGTNAKFWDADLFAWLDGTTKKEKIISSSGDDEIIVTTDGDGYRIRAQAAPHGLTPSQPGRFMTISESNGGENYDWAARLPRLSNLACNQQLLRHLGTNIWLGKPKSKHGIAASSDEG